MSISNKAILANLSISQWAGRKLDRKASGQVETAFSTDKRIGNFTKRLLPEAKELKAIETISSETRKFFNDQTLPWLSDGSRIVSSKNYFELITEIRKRKDNFNLAVDNFLGVYSTLRDSAKIKLGSLFNEADYPNVNSLKRKFSFEIVFLPLPEVSDFRTEVLDSEKQEFIAKMQEIQSKGLRECYEKLKTVVENAAERLKNPDAVFRDSLIENINEICALLPKLNVSDDAGLEKIRIEVLGATAKISPSLCRENKTERENAAKKLSEINSKMNVLMNAVGKE